MVSQRQSQDWNPDLLTSQYSSGDLLQHLAAFTFLSRCKIVFSRADQAPSRRCPGGLETCLFLMADPSRCPLQTLTSLPDVTLQGVGRGLVSTLTQNHILISSGCQNEYAFAFQTLVRAVGPFRWLPDPPLWLGTLLPPWLPCGLSLLCKIPALSVTGKKSSGREPPSISGIDIASFPGLHFLEPPTPSPGNPMVFFFFFHFFIIGL